jgi:hypothetical protein
VFLGVIFLPFFNPRFLGVIKLFSGSDYDFNDESNATQYPFVVAHAEVFHLKATILLPSHKHRYSTLDLYMDHQITLHVSVNYLINCLAFA